MSQPTAALDEVLGQAKRLVAVAITEDLGTGDVTTESLVEPDRETEGRFRAKQDGMLAGLPIAEMVFKTLSPEVMLRPVVIDGVAVSAGDEIAVVSGPARAILSGERTALNFLQRLSGIATLTAAFVKAVEGTNAAILDTRKTTPGWRVLEKYAVRMGGGTNHRVGLYDMALIKDNHIVLAGETLSTTDAIGAAVRMVRKKTPQVQIQVEVEDEAQLEQALEAGADFVMLDNFSLKAMRSAVEKVKRWRETRGQAPLVEASGGVTLETVRAIAETGVDRISVGALTHSAPALDISLDL